MRRRNLGKVALLFLCTMVVLGGCSNTAHKPRPATFDGDLRMAGKSQEFYSQHRVVTLNGHDLYQRGDATVRDQRIDCLLRECKLRPGQHSIDDEYFWSSIEAEKKKNRRDAGRGFLFVLGMLSGAGGDLPDGSRFFPCRASLSFEVQSARDYLLNVVHTDQSVGPEYFQIVDSASGVVVGSARPSCNSDKTLQSSPD